MKKLLSAMLIGGLVASLAACGSTEPTESEQGAESIESVEPVTIKVGVPTAPPALPILRMMDSGSLGDDVEIELTVWNEPESLIAMVQDGSHDMFAFPLTVVATLFNRDLDVRLMNVNTWGVTYFVTTNENFESWEDLTGETIFVPNQTSPVDALIQFFLNEAGLEVGVDVFINYASGAEIATLLASGDAVYASLLEPQVTSAMQRNENLRIAFGFEEGWQRVTETDMLIPNAGFGSTQSFIDENPELTARFQEEFEKALEWVVANPEEAGALAEEHLGMNANLIANSIPRMGLEFRTAQDSLEELEAFYQLLYDFNPRMIGGSLPTDDMFYEGK